MILPLRRRTTTPRGAAGVWGVVGGGGGISDTWIFPLGRIQFTPCGVAGGGRNGDSGMVRDTWILSLGRRTSTAAGRVAGGQGTRSWRIGDTWIHVPLSGTTTPCGVDSGVVGRGKVGESRILPNHRRTTRGGSRGVGRSRFTFALLFLRERIILPVVLLALLGF